MASLIEFGTNYHTEINIALAVAFGLIVGVGLLATK